MGPLARRLRLLATVAFVALIAIQRAGADTVALKSGETVIGQVMLERSDDEILVVVEAVTNTPREIDWRTVAEADAGRYMAEGRKLNGGIWYTMRVPGERIVHRFDGVEMEARGFVEREDGGIVYLRDAGSAEPRQIALVDIVTRDPVDLNPQDVWSPTELFEAKKRALAPRDYHSWTRLAVFGERVGVYDLARNAFEGAADATSDDSLKAEAGAGAARVIETARVEEDARGELKALRVLLEAARWGTLREALASFPERHPKATEPVKRSLATLRADYRRERTTYFAKRVMSLFEMIGRRLIEDHVRPRDAVFNDVQSWLRKNAIEEIFGGLATRFHADDPGVTSEEARSFFDVRAKSEASWHRASYDSGSFIFRPGGLRVPTRDQWWETATGETRARFWWATFVESTSVLETRRFAGRLACSTCDGAGKLGKVGVGGAGLEYLCPRCHGLKFDHVVEYR